MESSGTSRKAALTTLGAHDYITFAPIAALHAHSELIALDPVHPRTLHYGLNDFARKNSSRSGRTLHVELSAANGRLNSHRLRVIKHLVLTHTHSPEV